MDYKTKILNLVESELDNIIKNYEDTIKTQKEELLKLSRALQESDLELLRLQNEFKKYERHGTLEEKDLDKLADKKMLQYEVTNEDIDKLSLSQKEEDLVFLMKACSRMWKNLDIERLTYVFEQLNANSEILRKQEGEAAELFLKLAKTILLTENITESEHDRLISEVISLLFKMTDAPFYKRIKKFIKLQHDKILENVLSRNVPAIIAEYLRMLLLLNHREEVKESLIHILNIEWGFLDSSLTKANFEFFLWYSYLFDLDEIMIDRSSTSLQWFNENSPVLSLYFYFSKENNKEKYDFKLNRFLSGEVLNKFEKNLVVKKITSEREMLFHPTEKILKHLKPLIVMNKQNYPLIYNKFKLRNKKVKIPLYQKNKLNQIYYYIETDVMFYSELISEFFILDDDYKKLEKQYSPLIIKTKNLDSLSHLEQKTTLDDINFAWPSTEINWNNEYIEADEKKLNDKSELNLLGYQITGINRERRWRILEKAVPELGLKKVAYTISYNVKLRKGQKNGEKKYQYAISEWEYDLRKLKKHYYKQDFKWPETD
ncbi:hypothetical protein [Planomicrobium okeanokoites]|uniref:hypothetical protein n=1 Tax=Planomicrobium okeanokoites TaxID=244 RepID=UPI00248FFE0B|nr:hypothetical protein [Planomicrobium okeanokoites]